MTITVTNLLLWALLLIVQNAAFTLVSRARNSGSYAYHAIAAVFSNGIWFASQFLLIAMVAWKQMPLTDAIICGVVYICATVTGSVLMHWVSINYLEKGKRKVGG